MFGPGAPVEQMEILEERVRGVGALNHADVYRILPNGAPLPFDLGPAGGLEGEQEVIETPVSPIEPEQMAGAQPHISVFGKQGVKPGFGADKI